MTASVVDGHEVIATEQVPSNLWTPERQVYWSSVLKLLLDNDTTTFGCTMCDFTAEKSGQVRYHVSSVHRQVKTGWHAHREAAETNGKFTPDDTGIELPIPDDDEEEDLLAVLEAALSGGGEQVAALKKEVAALEKRLKSMTTDRDKWKAIADKHTARMTKLRTALKGAMTDGK